MFVQFLGHITLNVIVVISVELVVMDVSTGNVINVGNVEIFVQFGGK